jgi:7-cyano-7-deazaguanine reductase
MIPSWLTFRAAASIIDHHMTSTARPSANELMRPRLQTTPTPTPSRMATLVTFSARLASGVKLTIAYVPDRLVLTRGSFTAYAAGLADQTGSPEALAAAVAEDVANEVVPKWQRVTLAITVDGVIHTIVAEDRQPGWEHPSLLTAADTATTKS